jgi:hypothetical protein
MESKGVCAMKELKLDEVQGKGCSQMVTTMVTCLEKVIVKAMEPELEMG